MKESLHKVVTPYQMAAYEKYFIERDQKLSEVYMDTAANEMVTLFLRQFREKVATIYVLAGKGNNGGDGYKMGTILLSKGYPVVVYQILPISSDLTKKKAKEFIDIGGKVINFWQCQELDFIGNYIIIDAILGTGFTKEVDGEIQKVIEKCNKEKRRVFSIDIPSGIDGSTGKKKPLAIQATITAALGAYKVGHFFYDGLVYAGELFCVSFGLSTSCIESEFEYYDLSRLKGSLIKPKITAHKYEVGQVCMLAGSKSMMGAARLAGIAAMKAGCGIVKHFYIGDGTIVDQMEVVSAKASKKAIEQELVRSKALLIGPGIGKSKEAEKFVRYLSKKEGIIKVVDGDGLNFIDPPYTDTIITPHLGELAKLLGKQRINIFEDLCEIQEYANRYGLSIIVKGVPNIIIMPNQKKVLLRCGNIGMATAGSGDVLAGILTSLVAQGYRVKEAMTLAVLMHGKSGDYAAENFGRNSLCAKDILDNIYRVFLDLQ